MQWIHFGKYTVRKIKDENVLHAPLEANGEYYLSYNKDNGVIKFVPVMK
jgi:hypothetical protein